PVELPRADGLPGRGIDVLHPDGGHPRRGRDLRTDRRYGAADGDGDMSSIAVPTAREPNFLATVLAVVRRHVLTVYSFLFFAYLLLPIDRKSTRLNSSHDQTSY